MNDHNCYGNIIDTSGRWECMICHKVYPQTYYVIQEQGYLMKTSPDGYKVVKSEYGTSV